MAWVHQKNTKPKRKDPAESVESTRSLLLFLSGRPPPKTLSQVIHKPPPPNEYIEPRPRKQQHEHEYDEDRPSSRHHCETADYDDEADAHAFSFSRNRLVPIAPKQSNAPKNDRSRVDQQKRIASRTMTQYTREPSPPPPPRPRAKPRSVANVAPKLPRHYVAPDASSRVVSPMWASATTPLQM